MTLAGDEHFDGCEFELGPEKAREIVEALEDRKRMEFPPTPPGQEPILWNLVCPNYCIIRFRLKDDDLYVPRVSLVHGFTVCWIRNRHYEVSQSSISVLDRIVAEARTYDPLINEP